MPRDDGIVPFRGERQAGITTAAQDRLHLVALDVVTDDRDALRDLLTRWTARRRADDAGRRGRTRRGRRRRARGTCRRTPARRSTSPPGHLTVTIGYGPTCSTTGSAWPTAGPRRCASCPAFLGDDLDPARSGGDIVIQACSDDPQVAVHAVRNLVRIGFGVVAVRWSQLGFGRTSSTSQAQATPRNMFGFKDGTANLKSEDTAALDEHVWVAPPTCPGGRRGWPAGSYLVARRIRMHIEIWDRTPLMEQEQIVGRDKKVGAPLGRPAEFDEPDFAPSGTDGEPRIPVTAHVRLAHHSNLGGVRILRRGYNFTDGTDGQGHLDAGPVLPRLHARRPPAVRADAARARPRRRA